MASAVDYDDLDAEEEQAPAPAPALPPPDDRSLRRPSAATTGAAEDVVKLTEAEQRALLVDAVKTRDRLYDSIVCALLLIVVACLLAFVSAKILMATDPEIPYTHIIRNTHTPFEPVSTNDSDVRNETELILAPEVDKLLDVGPEAEESLEQSDAPAEGSYFFCGTEACKNMAAYLEGLLSPHHDTCSSLYDHVCSGWTRRHRHLLEARGHYSVDDAVLDSVLEQVGLLLSSPEVAVPEQRGFYSDCIAGRLVSERDLEDITSDLVSLTEEPTPDTLAKVTVRMASIGVSPFFEVLVEDINDTFCVNLVYTKDGATKAHFVADYQRSNIMNQNNINKSESAVASALDGRNDSAEFFLALERHMCLKVTQMAGVNRSCVLSLDSSKKAAWGYQWYASNGPSRLSADVAFMLEDLSAYHKEIEKMVHSFTSFRITAAPKRERMVRCIRFIDRYDPDLIPHLLTNNLAPLLKADARDTLSQLKAVLYKKMPKASAIELYSDAVGHSKNDSFGYTYSDNLYGKNAASNTSRLKWFLEKSTWKRWTGDFISRISALSFTPTFSDNSSTLEVPIGVFNLTASRDQWLHELSLARTGPRVLKTLFVGVLSPELARTHFFKCISERSKSVRHFNERGFWGVIRKVALFAGYGDTSKDSELQLDLEELASFYVSFQAYRTRVGEAVAVPGSLLNSDTLFLLYYVFNNCEVDASGTTGGGSQDTAGHGDRGSRGVTSRRHRVDSVAAMFGGLLLEKCVAFSDLSSCEVESDGQF